MVRKIDRVCSQILAVMIGTFVFAGQGVADGDGPKSADPRDMSPEARLLAELTSLLELTRQQRARVAAAIETRRAGYARWSEQRGPLNRELQRRLEAACAAGDKRAIAGIGKHLDALRAERDRVEERFYAQAMSLLSAQQRMRWEAHGLSRHVRLRLAGVALSRSQVASIQALCSVAAEQLLGVPPEFRRARRSSGGTPRSCSAATEHRARMPAT